ncbi:MAG: Monosaccharide transporter rane protein family [Propionibacteriaceae bacterium]|nr:Monosaccharide transporter rane protein family [Propionibacteriaceae bacterium]
MTMTSTPTAMPVSTQSKRSPTSVLRHLTSPDKPYLMTLVLIVLVIIFALASPVFFSTSNFLNIGRQTALVTIIAVGMTFVIVSGEIDLSVGAQLALAGIVASTAMQATGGQLMAGVIAGLLVGAVVGLANGLITTGLGIPSFLVTLAMLGICRGLALLISGGQAVLANNSWFWTAFNNGIYFGIPVPVWWTLLALIVGAFLLHVSSYGRKVYAVGGNKQAASYSGIRVHRVKILAFVLTGTLAGFAGLILTARGQGARPDVGVGLELDVIAAVILGGTSLFGGRGLIVGTLVGSLMIGVINNGLTLVGADSATQAIVKGLIIIVAVTLFTRGLRRR